MQFAYDLGDDLALSGQELRKFPFILLAPKRLVGTRVHQLDRDVQIVAPLGNKEKTFEWLEKAFQARDTDLPRFRLGPTFDPVRDDPRYKDLVKRMNLPE